MSLHFPRDQLSKPAHQDQREFIRVLLENFQMPEGSQSEFVRGLRQLAPRQRQVFILLCRGYSLRLIGAQLKISPLTARSHARILYQKVGLTSRCEVQAAMLVLALSRRGRRAL